MLTTPMTSSSSGRDEHHVAARALPDVGHTLESVAKCSAGIADLTEAGIMHITTRVCTCRPALPMGAFDRAEVPHRCCDKHLGNDNDEMDRITDEVSHLFTLQQSEQETSHKAPIAINYSMSLRAASFMIEQCKGDALPCSRMQSSNTPKTTPSKIA